MAPPHVEALTLRIILNLPSGTELSAGDLQDAVNQHLPTSRAFDDLAAIQELAHYLASLGYLLVFREEPGLYRVP